MVNKNILFFTRSMQLGGTENVILKLCKAAQEAGHQVVVCSNGGVNVEQLRELGITHYHIPDITNKNPLVMFRVLCQLKRIIRKENIGIVHTHHRMAAFYVQLVRKRRHLPVISTVHNTFYDKKRLTRFCYNDVQVIAVGNRVKENLCVFYKIPESQVTVIFNGVEEFSGEINIIPDIEKYRKDGFFIVGNIGRLSEQKGFKYYIDAIPLVLKQEEKIKFFSVGSGEDREELEKVVQLNNLENDVIFLGYRSDIQNVMSQLDLIVLSSLWEGLPLTPIEAFSVHKSIVATKVDGTSEIIINEENGLLVEPKCSEEIAEAILELVHNPLKLKDFEENGYKTYQQKFSLKRFNQCYLEYYKTIQG